MNRRRRIIRWRNLVVAFGPIAFAVVAAIAAAWALNE